jgi:hypothetical protein
MPTCAGSEQRYSRLDRGDVGRALFERHVIHLTRRPRRRPSCPCPRGRRRRQPSKEIAKRETAAGYGDIGNHSRSGSARVRGAVSVRIPRSGVVSRLQQAAKIALAHNCVPGIAVISAMMIRWPAGRRRSARRRSAWRATLVWLYFRRGGKLVGVAIIEAPTLYHARTRVAVRGIGKAVDYSDAKKTR